MSETTATKAKFSMDQLTDFEGKKLPSLTIVAGDDGSEELQNVILVGITEAGGVFQVPKKGAVLYKEAQILDFEAPEIKPPKRKVKNLKVVESDTVTDHLLDKHGLAYEECDAIGDDAIQLTWHEARHNAEGLTLAHRHGTPEAKSDAEKAVEAAGEGAADAA